MKSLDECVPAVCTLRARYKLSHVSSPHGCACSSSTHRPPGQRAYLGLHSETCDHPHFTRPDEERLRQNRSVAWRGDKKPTSGWIVSTSQLLAMAGSHPCSAAGKQTRKAAVSCAAAAWPCSGMWCATVQPHAALQQTGICCEAKLGREIPCCTEQMKQMQWMHPTCRLAARTFHCSVQCHQSVRGLVIVRECYLLFLMMPAAVVVDVVCAAALEKPSFP